MARRGTPASTAGFTLVEAMISMFFIAFIVGELAMVSTYARRSSGLARRMNEANMIAEGVLEKSRNAAYSNLNTRFSALDTPADPIVFDLDRNGALESYSETCNPAIPSATTVVSTCTATAGIYTVTRTVSPLVPSTATTFQNSLAAAIDVVVTWQALEAGNQLVVKDVKVSTVRSKF